MEIKQENNEQRGKFKAYIDHKEAGFLTYTWPTAEIMILDHTEVLEGFEGKGIGKKLVTHAANYAREHSKKIIPVCSFAKSIFEKVESIQDVLNHEY